jgi:polyhydroxyalkanoate synthase subunit PhaC
LEERLSFEDLIGRQPRFVLAASGHVAGVVNPPAKNRRSHWLNDDVTGDADTWLSNAHEQKEVGGAIGTTG